MTGSRRSELLEIEQSLSRDRWLGGRILEILRKLPAPDARELIFTVVDDGNLAEVIVANVCREERMERFDELVWEALQREKLLAETDRSLLGGAALRLQRKLDTRYRSPVPTLGTGDDTLLSQIIALGLVQYDPARHRHFRDAKALEIAGRRHEQRLSTTRKTRPVDFSSRPRDTSPTHLIERGRQE